MARSETTTDRAEFGRQEQPDAVAAERAVLAAVLVDPRQLDAVLERIRTASDFFDERNQRIFRAICKLDDEGHGASIDLLTVSARLEQAGELEKVGGNDYLAALTAGVPQASNAGGYAEVVRENAVRRRLLGFAAKVSEGARKRPASEVLAAAEAELFAIAEGSHTSAPQPIAEMVSEIEAESRRERKEIDGHSTGFRPLDELMGGLRREDLVLVGARPGEGKSSLALNMTLACGKAGKKVLFFSLEMPGKQIGIRLAYSLAEVDAKQLQRKGKLKNDDIEKVSRALAEIRRMKIFVDDSNVTPVELRSKSRQFRREHEGLDLIVVDYLQLMSGTESGRFENRTLEIASISRGLKLLARELNVPILALSQLNRAKDQAGEFAPPRLSHLRESGALEQDADIVLLLHRPRQGRGGQKEDAPEAGPGEDMGPPIRQVIVAKNRNGPTGIVELAWLDRYTKFKVPDEDYGVGPDSVAGLEPVDDEFSPEPGF